MNKAELERDIRSINNGVYANREWEEQYFSLYHSLRVHVLNKDLRALQSGFQELADVDEQLWNNRALTPGIFAGLVLINRTYQIYLKLERPSDDKCFNSMFGYLLIASYDREEERLWREGVKELEVFQRVQASETKEVDIHKPELHELPGILLTVLLHYGRIEAYREVIRFLVFGYQEAYERLLNESLDMTRWWDNLRRFEAYLVMRHVFPLMRRGKMTMLPYFTTSECEQFYQEFKKQEEHFANVGAMMMYLLDRFDDWRKWETEDHRQFLRDLVAQYGRIEVRKSIIMGYKNRLTLPTFIYRQYIDALSNLP
jgi:hypothetical protein